MILDYKELQDQNFLLPFSCCYIALLIALITMKIMFKKNINKNRLNYGDFMTEDFKKPYQVIKNKNKKNGKITGMIDSESSVMFSDVKKNYENINLLMTKKTNKKEVIVEVILFLDRNITNFSSTINDLVLEYFYELAIKAQKYNK
jgi:hypothetical protein